MSGEDEPETLTIRIRDQVRMAKKERGYGRKRTLAQSFFLVFDRTDKKHFLKSKRQQKCEKSLNPTRPAEECKFQV